MKKFAVILSALILSAGVISGCTDDTVAENPVSGGEEAQNAENTPVPENDSKRPEADEATVTYKEAYAETVEMLKNVYDVEDCAYGLLDINGDEVPELVAGYPTLINLYTFENGKVYPLMEEWGFGAGGNEGYKYLPGKNVIQNIDADMAGALVYETYWKIGDTNEIELYYDKPLYTTLWRDTDGNGVPDEGEEEGEFYYYGINEITKEEYEAYLFDGGFEYVEGNMSYDEIVAELSK